MVVDLMAPIDDLVADLRSKKPARAAAKAMQKTFKKVAQRHLGRDLRLSGMKAAGRAKFTTKGTKADRAKVAGIGGVYILADQGRNSVVEARGRLNTPWGVRSRVKGSLWPGFGITDEAARSVFNEGATTVLETVKWG